MTKINVYHKGNCEYCKNCIKRIPALSADNQFYTIYSCNEDCQDGDKWEEKCRVIKTYIGGTIQRIGLNGDPEWTIDGEQIDYVISPWNGKKVKITIEEVEE